MNISQLETLITISKTMSFRKAGELLNLTQPAVSAQIKSLEEEFKTQLVDRNQPVTLTDRGTVFLEHAEQIVRIVEELKERLADLDENPQGHIVLGTTTSIAIQILPRILSYFKDQFPHIKTSISSMSSSQIYQHVENGIVDVGIGYLIGRSPGMSTSILYYDTFELVVSPRHPLAQVKTAGIEALSKTPLILLSPDTVGRKFADEVLNKHGIQPQVIMELTSSEEVKRMVELDLGAAIISKQSVTAEVRAGTLKIVPIIELEVTHPVGVITKSGKYVNSAMRQFLSDLKGMPETQFIGSE
ncbi:MULTISPECIES: LysR family transcriptional regulator [Paenibacillus]|jgi:DNA-binding transcriptional LysR family regulator|uniref:LysR family transcriptional regulator n=1 Tax=Paenibacillus odorifer TaxID=189426 RepID=A0A1R0YVW7_9BACL|nr:MULTISPECIES: LysR family transcriptional regulator [Paenibacillus]AIQ76343.1 LysR family transcriptional regulator [Paenibacillus odorifer]AWV35633.1 LysR family transcriptional regulator [Paenibacillus odorifer]MDH6430994.1 DNA-binding transcriptional LysR family regulator [Paenibacillus sp. PastH-4]MDH6446806.1 DNA-binding transcriptional LysR family regulator [Paenibacillus sp. PastF-4]MDH6531111.1 DNA-binding transcriptional LysR family regulator [Paenibacillus sp. PastH-3]